MRIAPQVRAWFVGVLLISSGSLVVVTAWLLTPFLREACIRQAITQSNPPVNTPLWWPRSWRREYQVRRVLLEPVTLQFVRTPLSDVRDFLQDYSGLNIDINFDELAENAVTADTTITINVSQIALRSALRLTLDQIGLTFVIQDGSLVVVPKGEESVRFTARSTPSITSFGMTSLHADEVCVRRDVAFAAAYSTPSVTGTTLLIDALQDSDPDVRFNAAFALGEFGQWAEPAIPSLAQLSKTDQPTVCWSVTFALGKLRPHAETALIESLLVEDRYLPVHVLRFLSPYGPEATKRAVDRMIEALRDSDPHTRCQAAAALGDLKGDAIRALPAIVEALSDPDARREAANTLGSFGPHAMSAVPALIRQVNCNIVDDQLAAIYALGRIGRHAQVALPVLQHISDEDHRDVVKAKQRAAAMIEDQISGRKRR